MRSALGLECPHTRKMTTADTLSRLRVVTLLIFFLMGVFVLSTVAQKTRAKGSAANQYSVEILTNQRFRVTATFNDLRGSFLDVSLPVWTPGVYNRKNYAKNVRRFTAFDEKGTQTTAHKIAASTWRIDTHGGRQVRVEFNYVATDLSWNGAGITPTHALFTGTQLFLEQMGKRQKAATVSFKLPDGWKIVTSLTKTANPLVYFSGNYDDLVDSVTLLGSVDVTSIDIDGTPFVIARAPAGAACTHDWEAVQRELPSVVRVQRNIFGSLPFSEYTIICIENMDGGSVEHGNSFVTSWLGSINIAHEIFHAWNVKRIRGAEMWPYNYQSIEPGPSLWVAEGVTSYFESLFALRAGVQGLQDAVDGIGPDHFTNGKDPEQRFLDHLGSKIAALESIPARAFVSPADASVSDGLEYGAVNPSYYLSGEILGALLDLSILHDTNGERRLDDVMRALYKDYYLRGRGYTTVDLIKTVSSAAGKDYTPFFENYVTGTAVPAYDTLFSYAGYKIVKSSRKLGNLGFLWAVSTPEGRLISRPVDENSPAAKAGVKQGDLILAVDGVPIHQVPLARLAGKNWMGGEFLGKAGERILLRIRRADGKEADVPVVLGTVDESVFRLEKDTAATAGQLRIRSKWLER